MTLEAFKNIREDDCVEAEIVSGPGAGSQTGGGARTRRERPDDGAPRPGRSDIPFYGLFLRVKFLFVTVGLLAGFALIFLGLILTSTVIGAIIGVPLLILGGLCLWLLFKLLTFGQKTRPVIFRRF
jgi:hypothetical protein